MLGRIKLIPAPELYGTRENAPWSRHDLIIFSLCLICSLVAMSLSGVTVYSNLQASGEVIFQTKPFLAVALSLLAPIGSLTLKLLTYSMDSDLFKRWYARFLSASALVSLGYWAFFFAQNFAGLSGSVDYEALVSGSHGGVHLVMSQLAAEILVGSTLAQNAEHVYLRNSPSHVIPNPEYIDIKKALEAQRKETKTAYEAYENLQAEVSVMEAERELFIADVVGTYESLREHAQALHPA